MQNILQEAVNNNRHFAGSGKVASYIPELAKKDPNILAASIYKLDNTVISAGDYHAKFTIQSVSKVVMLICAILDKGKDTVFSNVGMEPSADAFDSIVKLETRDSHKPLNPFINAGAIICTSLVSGIDGLAKFNRIHKMIQLMADNTDIDIDQSVYRSEKKTGDTNRAIAYYLKGAGLIENGVDDILDAYFKLCSLEVTIMDIAKMASVIANNGITPWNNVRIIPHEICRTVKAIMTSCGLYDSSGEFSVKVGIPAKSGVGGCIMAISPNNMGIAVLGPSLDPHGNSIAGKKVLEEISLKLDLSIF